MQLIDCKDGRFVDACGRHVILNGINLIYKGEGKKGSRIDQGPWRESDLIRIRDWGFNVVRLGLIWEAAEPEPGIYYEPYLDWIGSLLDCCARHGLYAFLDMHQDLYGACFSDGAPAWATLTDGRPHVDGELWSDAYLFSEAVQHAFDHFWANDPAPDGRGLQDHYGDLWLHIVRRFAGHPALIGYDLLNEPFPGSSGRETFAALLSGLAELRSAAEGRTYTLPELLAAFSQPEEKTRELGLLEDKALYRQMVQFAEPLIARFDRSDLDAFYRRMTEAIRTVDRQGIIFRENSYFSNMGILCQADLIRDAAGRPDARQAYAPHGYDLVVDSAAITQASNQRAEVIFEAHGQVQQRLGVPLLVGEWGAHGHSAQGLDHIQYLLAFFDRNQWSQTYWCYEDQLPDAPVLNILIRPCPRAVQGRLLSYAHDRAGKRFLAEWDEAGVDPDSTEPSEFYIPGQIISVVTDGGYAVRTLPAGSLLQLPYRGGQRSLTVVFEAD